MRRTLVLPVLLIVAVVTLQAQQDVPRLSSETAKDHVGEVARVCGQVVELVCRDSSPPALIFGPADQPQPFKVSVSVPLPASPLVRRRLDEEFFGKMVCVQGTIERAENSVQVTVPDSTHLQVQQEDRLPEPPRPRTNTACRPDLQFPVVTKEVKPVYTPNAMRDKVEGAVLMEIVVLPDGSVGNVTVVRPLHPELDVQATTAARQWKFNPATLDGKPVAMLVTLELTFTLRSRQ